MMHIDSKSSNKIDKGIKMARSSEEMRKIDKFIGAKFYKLRLKARMSRQRLSKIMGVSCQQATKYETGVNRISASRMFLIANALGIKPEIFYEGLAEYLASDTENNDICNHNAILRSAAPDLANKYLAKNLSSNNFRKKGKTSSSTRLLKLRTPCNVMSYDDITDKNDAYSDEPLNLECA